MHLDAEALLDVADLTCALERECRMLDELHRAVLQQREAVALGDAPGVESSNRLAGRALLTLQENRRHRATLLQRMVGDLAQPLADLEAHFDTALQEPFLAARRRMQSSANVVAGEVCRNQEVLLGVLRERDAMLQQLLTGSRARPSAEQRSAARAEG